MRRTLILPALIAAGLDVALLGFQISPSSLPGPMPERNTSDEGRSVDEASWYVIVEEPTTCFRTAVTGCGCPLFGIRLSPLVTDYVSRPITSYLPVEPLRPPALNVELRARDLIEATELTPAPKRSHRRSNQGRM